MERIFLDIKKQQAKKIGIYHFNNALSIGKVINNSKSYLYLESYNINNEKDELKIFLIDKIKRVMLNSKYIEQLDKKNKLKKINFKWLKKTDIRTFDEIVSKIIEKKILVLLSFVDGNQEKGYIVQNKNNSYYFNIVNNSLEIISNEIFDKFYIKEIRFLNNENIGNQSKKVKIKLYSEEIYIGNIFTEKENIILLTEIKEFSEESRILLIKKDDIEEITELIEMEKFEIINFETYFKNFNNMTFFEVLQICQKFKIIIFIDNEYFSETKVGIIVGLKEDILNLKLLDINYHFTEILKLKITEIEILRIKSYRNI